MRRLWLLGLVILCGIAHAQTPSWRQARLVIPGSFSRLSHISVPGGIGTSTAINGDVDTVAFVFSVPFDGVITETSFNAAVVGTGGDLHVQLSRLWPGTSQPNVAVSEAGAADTVAVSAIGQYYATFANGDTVSAGDTLCVNMWRIGGSSTNVTIGTSLGNAALFYSAMPYVIVNTSSWARDDVWPIFGVGGTDLSGNDLGMWPTGGYPMDSLVLVAVDSAGRGGANGIDGHARRFKTSYPMIVAGVEFDLQSGSNAPVYFFLTGSDTTTIANLFTNALNVSSSLDGRMIEFFDECPCTLDAETVYHLEMFPGNTVDVNVLEVVVKDSNDWKAYESIGHPSQDYGSYRWVSIDGNGDIQASGSRTANSLRRPVGFNLYVTGISAGLESGGQNGRRRRLMQMGIWQEATQTFAGVENEVDR